MKHLNAEPTAISPMLTERFWILHEADPLNDLSAYLQARNGSALFRLHLPVPGEHSQPPLSAVFELRAIATGSGRRRSIVFSWSGRNGFPLPTMHGTITSRCIGVLASVVVEARYSCANDVAGKLFHDTVGKQLAQATLAALMHALRMIVKTGSRSVTFQ